ncbi:MAG: polysaccharide biosynthesis tyrosine autokinase [Cyanobacteria bacterium P01_D01_bin.14]
MESKELLIEEVDVQRYWLVLKRRWLPATAVFTASVAAALFAALSQRPMYEATGKVLVQTDRAATLTGIAQELGEVESLMMTRDPLDTQEAIISSVPILEDTIRVLNIRDDRGELVTPERLAQGLQVTVLDGTDVLQIDYQSAQPELSAAVVNQIMQSYIATNIQSNRAEVRAARRFLERELPQAEADVERLSQALQQFNEQNRIVSLEKEADATVQAIAQLDSQIANTQAELARAESNAAGLRQQLGMPLDDALTLSALAQSSSVQQAYSNWQVAQTDLANARTRYTAQHPTIRELARQETAMAEVLQQRMYEVAGTGIPISSGTLQISPTQQRLADELVAAEIQRSSIYNQLGTLASTRDAYVEWADVFPSLERTQIELQQRLDYARTTYEALLKRLQEIRLAENQNVGSARVVEAANVPSEASASSQLMFLMLGSVVGVFMGIATAFLLDLIDRSIKTVKDAERALGYVMLGVIPKFELPHTDWQNDLMLADAEGLPSERIVTLQSTFPMVAGAYQMLQANLRFISSDKRLKSIVITSSIAGEGKSEVCANLAASIAQTNRRVLLVDGDMRSPQQHHLWNVLNATGLSHVLVGEGQLRDAVQPINENLSLLTAGVVPPNPLALIDSERMASLLATFNEQYDYVIIDTPALAGTADAAVLGSLADGILVVMRPRWVTYDGALSAKTLLTRSGANVLGIVANGADLKIESSEYVYSVQASGDTVIEAAPSPVPERAIAMAEAMPMTAPASVTDDDPWE